MVDKLIYPAYLDSQKTRAGGRRVPENLAVESPTVEEIELALKKIGYSSEIEQEKSYSPVSYTHLTLPTIYSV